jgi:hypothetical protein
MGPITHGNWEFRPRRTSIKPRLNRAGSWLNPPDSTT